MPLATKLMMALASMLVMLIIVNLVRRKRLDEKYALLWLVAGAVMMFAPLATRAIDMFSSALGFHYAPAFILLLGFFALCLINLQYSVVISRLTKNNKTLAQRLALMEQRLGQLEGKGGAAWIELERRRRR
ncbi:MAG TPA: DUF2304 domain-containing protein [Blastocatellia bacterium]|nr:DUF2304 domain-containing protein [Blastocatellia bacterium]